MEGCLLIGLRKEMPRLCILRVNFCGLQAVLYDLLVATLDDFVLFSAEELAFSQLKWLQLPFTQFNVTGRKQRLLNVCWLLDEGLKGNGGNFPLVLLILFVDRLKNGQFYLRALGVDHWLFFGNGELGKVGIFAFLDVSLESLLGLDQVFSQVLQNAWWKVQVVVLLCHLGKIQERVDFLVAINNQATDVQEFLVSIKILGRDALLSLQPALVQWSTLFFGARKFVVNYLFQLGKKLELLNLAISSVVWFAKERNQLGVQMLTSLCNVLESKVIISRLRRRLYLQHSHVKVLLVWVIVKLFGVLLKLIPIL